jgi:hypothetical protein
MDGSHDLAQLEAEFAAKFGGQLPGGMLEKFVQRLGSLRIVETDDSAPGAEPQTLPGSQERGLGRLLFIRLKAVNPDLWLGTWAQRLKFVFRPWFWPASVTVILAALWVVWANSHAFEFSLSGMLTGGSIAAVVFSMFAIISLHEIAHGLTCRHLGGHVHEMGFLLLYFQPCLYCDLSDSWLFREKWKKLLVTFSGAYVQILLGALAVLGWRITTVGTFPNQMFWLFAVISLFNVLFNFNPLIKLDGYYLLSDGLGIPNLRARAFAWLAHGIFAKEWPHAELPTRRERRIYWAYGVGAVLYSAFLIGYLAVWLFGFMVTRWRGTGFVLYLMLAAIMFREPLVRGLQRAIPRRIYRLRRTMIWVAIGLVLLVAMLVPFPYRVGSPARIEPWAQMSISVSPDGFVFTEWYERGEAESRRSQISKLVTSGFTTLVVLPEVRVGDTVAAGDTVLRVAADQFSSLYEEAQATLRAKEAELKLLLSPPRPQEVAEQQARIREESSLVVQRRQDFERAQSLYERKLTPKSALEQSEAALNAEEARLTTAQQTLEVLKAPPKSEAVDQVKADIARLTRQVEFYAGQLKATVFTAPVGGQVVWLSTRDREVCRIVRTDSVRCAMDVDESYAPLVQSGQDVTLKLPSSPFDTYHGTLVRVARVGQFREHSSSFSAVAALANPGGLDPGMTGYAKVLTGNRTFAWRVIRRFVRFFRIEFWSWW